MKTRKIFLDGYVELKPSLFTSKTYQRNDVGIDSARNIINIGNGVLAMAQVKLEKGETANVRIGIHNSKDKFIIVFDEEADFKARRYSSPTIQICSAGAVRGLIKNGWHHKRYKATSPEQGVVIVTKEEV